MPELKPPPGHRFIEDRSEIDPMMATYATAAGFRVIADVFEASGFIQEAKDLRRVAIILEPVAGTG